MHVDFPDPILPSIDTLKGLLATTRAAVDTVFILVKVNYPVQNYKVPSLLLTNYAKNVIINKFICNVTVKHTTHNRI